MSTLLSPMTKELLFKIEIQHLLILKNYVLFYFIQIVKEFGSFDKYLWAFFGNKPIVKIYRDTPQVPSKTPKSEYVSKDLVKRGFRFVGPSIVYSFMQASGMTNDHLVQCFRQQACKSFYQNSGPQLT